MVTNPSVSVISGYMVTNPSVSVVSGLHGNKSMNHGICEQKDSNL